MNPCWRPFLFAVFSRLHWMDSKRQKQKRLHWTIQKRYHVWDFHLYRDHWICLAMFPAVFCAIFFHSRLQRMLFWGPIQQFSCQHPVSLSHAPAEAQACMPCCRETCAYHSQSSKIAKSFATVSEDIIGIPFASEIMLCLIWSKPNHWQLLLLLQGAIMSTVIMLQVSTAAALCKE